MPKIQVVLSDKAEQLLRAHVHKRGDLSAIIETLILERAERDKAHNGK